MQTFLPYADFTDANAVLDTRRLGKQRVETFQILRALTWPSYAWKNHPAVRMWRGFVPALVAYGVANCAEWSRRGFSDSVRASLLAFSGGVEPDPAALRRRGELPPWLGEAALHRSHQSALVRKSPDWYGPLFGDVPDDLPYWWPPDLFPRWPLRSRAPLPVDAAACALGLGELRPAHVEAATAIAAGRDCLLVAPPGVAARSAGLFVGLTVPSPTLWVLPRRVPAGSYLRAAVVPEVATATPRSTRAVAPTARRAGPEELAAMAVECEPAPWRFARPGELPALGDLARVALLVIESAADLSAADARRTAAFRTSHGGAPMLALTTDPRGAGALIRRLGLVDPALA